MLQPIDIIATQMGLTNNQPHTTLIKLQFHKQADELQEHFDTLYKNAIKALERGDK